MMLVKEELVQYLTHGYIHVSRQDYLFFSNLVKFSNAGTLTTGQDKLLNKLIDKYQKQLKKENFDTEELKKLKWLHPLVETKPEYHKVYLSIVDNKLVIKNPFSKKFLQDLDKAGTANTLEWDKINKVYRAPLTTHILKLAIELTRKNFSEIVYCDNIERILKQVEEYKNCYWNPTLVEVNGQYYIAACNQHIANVIQDIKLEKNVKTFYALSNVGVRIDESISMDKACQFAASHYYEMDIEEIEELVAWLKQLNIQSVFVEHQMIYKNSIFKELKTKLEDNNIITVSRDEYGQYKTLERPIYITFKSGMYYNGMNKAGKIINIKNSRPILIK